MVLHTFARSLLAVNTLCYFHTCQIMTHGLIRSKLALHTKTYRYVYIRHYFTVCVLLEAQCNVVRQVSSIYPVRNREILTESGPTMSSRERITNYRILQRQTFSLSRLGSVLISAYALWVININEKFFFFFPNATTCSEELRGFSLLVVAIV